MSGKGPTSAARGNWPDTPAFNPDELPGACPKADADYFDQLRGNAAKDKAAARVAGEACYDPAGEPGQAKGRRR